MGKRVRYLISAGANIAVILLLIGAAKLFPQLYPAFYTDFSRGLNHFLGTVTSILPFPLWELLLLGLVVWQIVSLVRGIGKKQFLDWLCRFAVLLTTLALVFVAIWGLNFFGPGAAEATGLEVSAYSKSELEQAAAWYGAQASRWSAEVPRGEDGELLLPDEQTLSDAAVQSMTKLGEEYPRFENCAPRVKFLVGSELFGYMGVTGIYVCFTGESAVSRATYSGAIPFTMCHELGHSLCFCAEDEANFVGFLACTRSEDPLFRYSGYYSAFLYCYNTLYKIDAGAAHRLFAGLSDELLRDCAATTAHYKQYEGVVQQAAQSVNDAYLHGFDPDGVQSYNRVTDQLIAYYLQFAS